MGVIVDLPAQLLRTYFYWKAECFHPPGGNGGNPLKVAAEGVDRTTAIRAVHAAARASGLDPELCETTVWRTEAAIYPDWGAAAA